MLKRLLAKHLKMPSDDASYLKTIYCNSLLSGKILILSCNYWIFYVLWHNFSFSI